MKFVSIVVIENEGKILCIRRSESSTKTGQWECPAGHIDQGENPADAAIREAKEETGLDVTLKQKGFSVNLTEDMKGFIFLASTDRTDVKLEPTEHDAFKWVPVEKLSTVRPTPADFLQNIRKVLKMNNEHEVAKRVAFQEISGVGSLPEKLEDAILIGDQVDIFLSAKDDAEEPLSGVVDRRENGLFWLRDVGDESAAVKKVRWKDRGNWEVIRIRRFQEGSAKKFTYEKMDDIEEGEGSKGIALLIEPEPSSSNNSVFKSFPSVSPELDFFSSVQIPSSLQALSESPTVDYAVKNVRSLLQNNGVLDPYHVSLGQRGRVLILTHDPDAKEEIKKVLEKNGKKVKLLRKASKGYHIIASGKDLGATELVIIAIIKGRGSKAFKDIYSKAYNFLRKKTGITDGQVSILLGQYEKFIKNEDLTGYVRTLVDRGFDVPSELIETPVDNILRAINKYYESSTGSGIIEATKKNRCWKGYEPVPGKEPYTEDSCRKATYPVNPTIPQPAQPGQTAMSKPKLTVEMPVDPKVKTQANPSGVTLETTDPKALNKTLNTMSQGTVAASKIAILLKNESYQEALSNMTKLCRVASRASICSQLQKYGVSSSHWSALESLAFTQGEFPSMRVAQKMLKS